MIPVLGFATLTKFDLAQRLLDSIDYPIEHLIIVDNSGTKTFDPFIRDNLIKNTWIIRVPTGLGANGAWNLIIKSTPHAPYWIIANDDCWFDPGQLEIIAGAVALDAFNFVQIDPAWSCVIPTASSVEDAGLWDENFHPLYFDDDDYEWRMRELGVRFNTIPAKVNHDNSSTLKSGYAEKNAKSFTKNMRLFQDKKARRQLNPGSWSLKIRRENSWD